MNADMIGGIIRALAPAIIAYLVGAGTIPAADYGPVIAGVVGLVAAVWSIKTNQNGKVVGSK